MGRIFRKLLDNNHFLILVANKYVLSMQNYFFCAIKSKIVQKLFENSSCIVHYFIIGDIVNLSFFIVDPMR